MIHGRARGCPAAQSRVEPLSPAANAPQEGRGPYTWVKGYAAVIAVCVVIWDITSATAGELIYFWPVWLVIPLIFGVIGTPPASLSGVVRW